MHVYPSQYPSREMEVHPVCNNEKENVSMQKKRVAHPKTTHT